MRHLIAGLCIIGLTSCAHVHSDPSPTAPQIEVTQPAPTELQVTTFGPLIDYIGGTYRGVPGEASSEALVDFQHWEWALGGTAIKISHAIEDGSYGGDTYIYKDAASGDLVYVYITNAGFRTEGIIVLNADGSYTAEEDVKGHATITKVRSTSRLNDDGSSTMTSEYLDAGEWVPGHNFVYTATDADLPQLKAPSPQ